jgi:hypothetical protein
MPFGGMTWQVIHHLVALRRLGFDVWYVEDSDRRVLHPNTLNPVSVYEDNVTYGVKQLKRIGMESKWIFRSGSRQSEIFGSGDERTLEQLYLEADAVFNLCGARFIRPVDRQIGCLVLLQTDPVATQIYVANGIEWWIDQFDGYHYLYTYGENIGSPGCPIPAERHSWRPTRPPICIDFWQTDYHPTSGRLLTTIANLKDLGKDVEWEGEVYYWRKDLEFKKFRNLPHKSPLPLEIALEGATPSVREDMVRRGWRVISAKQLSDPDAYRSYIRNSAGEFTVAKDQNVRLKSGWFSDRSGCYLAAGRPVVTQDTGFGDVLPTGRGLFSYSTIDQALTALEAIAIDPVGHSNAAREIAREYFTAERVLSDILKEIGLI